MKTTIYECFEALESMEAEWDAFAQMAGCAIFMTFDWLRIWWKYYGAGRKLQIFVFRHEGRLVGIIPMFFEKIRLGPVSIRCGKIVGSDFTLSTIVLPIHKEFQSDVLEKFLTDVKTHCHWDILHIGPLSGLDSGFHDGSGLFRQYPENGVRVKVVAKDVQTFFVLRGSDGQDAETVSGKRERQMKQKYRILREVLGKHTESLTSHFVSDAEFEQTFADFVDMHQRHWNRQNQAGHFGDWPFSLEFHREAAFAQLKRGRLRLMELKTDGQPLGYKYSYKFGDTFVEFLDARADGEQFARAGLGNIVFYEQLKKARQEQVRYIDSGRGKYEHKLRMGGELFDMNEIYVFQNNLLAVARVNIFRVLARLFDICYYRVWYSRLAPKLALRRKPLRETWIRSAAFGR